MSNNQLRQKIQNAIIKEHGPTITVVIGDKTVDAILQAVIESLPEQANVKRISTNYWSGYNDGVAQIKSILTAAMSTGGDDAEE